MAGLASLRELQSFYGVKDLYDLLEIMAVQGTNQSEAMKEAQVEPQNGR
ncbi:hypothetical protein [Entomobacter blattae]|nr:hypothetical protein [Entomobacter blattae]